MDSLTKKLLICKKTKKKTKTKHLIWQNWPNKIVLLLSNVIDWTQSWSNSLRNPSVVSAKNLLFQQLFVIHLRTVMMHSWSYLSLALLDIQNMVVYLHLLDLMFYKTYNFYELFHRYDSFLYRLH